MSDQKGFSLVLAMVVIIIITLGSLMFMGRSSDDMWIGGSRQNADAAQALAEASANLLMARFISDDITSADINGDGIMDRAQGYVNISFAPTTLPLPYSFYAEVGNATPPIQRVATGESNGNSSNLTTQKIPSTSDQLLIENLFVSATIRPILIVQTPTGIVFSASSSWYGETSRNKAATWLEYEQNTEKPQWTDIYVASAAQTNGAKAYVRRFVGTYTDELGGLISPITESAIHAGGTGEPDTCVVC